VASRRQAGGFGAAAVGPLNRAILHCASEGGRLARPKASESLNASVIPSRRSARARQRERARTVEGSPCSKRFTLRSRGSLDFASERFALFAPLGMTVRAGRPYGVSAGGGTAVVVVSVTGAGGAGSVTGAA
jgi:hypothetical protein